MLITNEPQKLLFTRRVYWIPATVNILDGSTQISTDEWFVDVAQVYPATFQRSSVVFCNKKATILSSLFLDILRILAEANCNTIWYYPSCEDYFMTTCTVRSKIVALAQV